MRPKEFLSDRLGQMLLHLISMLFLSAFLKFTGTSAGVIVIVLICWVLGLAVILTFHYLKLRAYLIELENIINGLDQKYLFAECVPKPKGFYERILFRFMRRSGKSMIEAVSNAQEQQKDYREYIENWVHEIKVPITTARLICNNNKSDLSIKILPHLEQTALHVERVLYYARAGSIEKDFIVRETELFTIVTQAVARHKALLIQNGVRVEVSDLDRKVYTDGKWVEFMIGQIISNAVRYRREQPIVHIMAQASDNRMCLVITDNGIGIPAHELPRIFERGFTGSNEREHGGSTGMGLYICKKLGDFLQIEMSAESAFNEYTKISLTFPGKEILS